MEGKKEKGWRGKRRRVGEVYTFPQQRRRKRWKVGQTGVDRLCFPGKANGVVIILELGFGVRF